MKRLIVTDDWLAERCENGQVTLVCSNDSSTTIQARSASFDVARRLAAKRRQHVARGVGPESRFGGFFLFHLHVNDPLEIFGRLLVFSDVVGEEIRCDILTRMRIQLCPGQLPIPRFKMLQGFLITVERLRRN